MGRALNGLAGRLSGKHAFYDLILEVKEHLTAIEAGFLDFFPDLLREFEVTRVPAALFDAKEKRDENF